MAADVEEDYLVPPPTSLAAPPPAYPRPRAIFARPSSVLYGYLLPDEGIWYDQAPSPYALIFEQWPVLLLALLASAGIIRWELAGGNPRLAGFGLIVIGVMLAVVILKRVFQLYTRYVLTNVRIMRISGFRRREMAYIPWAKVTDVRYESSLVGRLFGYETVRIDSANEFSGLKEMTDLRDPRAFRERLDLGVRLRQGTIDVPSDDEAVITD